MTSTQVSLFYLFKMTAVSEINLATDSTVGWSNSSVCGKLVSKSAVSVIASSVAATESSPAAIKGKLGATAVPSMSSSDAEILSAVA